MYKIDLKDRKILYQLDLDSRQSLTQIGKNVGLNKDIVSYRIKKLQDEGVIKSFWTLIDAYKLSSLDSDKWLVWCFLAALFGLGASLVSVSLFGPPTTFFYMMLGFCGAMPAIVDQRTAYYICPFQINRHRI